ncbi:MAG: hypothetical protein AB7O66_19340 [Limisphaerales bacterium]
MTRQCSHPEPPRVHVNGLLVGLHDRRLTALDSDTGKRLWQEPEETDGQLIVLGVWLVFVRDRVGTLEVMSVTREGCRVVGRRELFKPTRMETPLTFSKNTLHIRTPQELIALRVPER